MQSRRPTYTHIFWISVNFCVCVMRIHDPFKFDMRCCCAMIRIACLCVFVVSHKRPSRRPLVKCGANRNFSNTRATFDQSVVSRLSVWYSARIVFFGFQFPDIKPRNAPRNQTVCVMYARHASSSSRFARRRHIYNISRNSWQVWCSWFFTIELWRALVCIVRAAVHNNTTFVILFFLALIYNMFVEFQQPITWDNVRALCVFDCQVWI